MELFVLNIQFNYAKGQGHSLQDFLPLFFLGKIRHIESYRTIWVCQIDYCKKNICKIFCDVTMSLRWFYFVKIPSCYCKNHLELSVSRNRYRLDFPQNSISNHIIHTPFNGKDVTDYLSEQNALEAFASGHLSQWTALTLTTESTLSRMNRSGKLLENLCPQPPKNWVYTNFDL